MSTDRHDRQTQALPVGEVDQAMAHMAERGDWRAALAHLVEQHPRGMTGVADDAAAMGLKGFGRVYISRVFMTGGSRIAQPSPAFVANVWALVGQVHCPHTAAAMGKAQCQAHHSKPYAQVGDARLPPLTTVQHWRECQKCPHNPRAKAPKATAPTAPTAQEASHA